MALCRNLGCLHIAILLFQQTSEWLKSFMSTIAFSCTASFLHLSNKGFKYFISLSRQSVVDVYHDITHVDLSFICKLLTDLSPVPKQSYIYLSWSFANPLPCPSEVLAPVYLNIWAMWPIPSSRLIFWRMLFWKKNLLNGSLGQVFPQRIF